MPHKPQKKNIADIANIGTIKRMRTDGGGEYCDTQSR